MFTICSACRQEGDPLVASSADKFFKTELENILRDRGFRQ